MERSASRNARLATELEEKTASMAGLVALHKQLRESFNVETAQRRAAQEEVAEVKRRFDDLKVRLDGALKANEFMRGYLARVGEDDVVREELVTVGEPGGEQHLTPKRRPASFPRPSDYTAPPNTGTDFEERYMTGSTRQERRKPRHWITY